MKCRILGICGSPRTASTWRGLQIAMESAAEELGGEGETELVSFKGKRIEPCNHCNACKKNGGTCVIKDDMTELYDKLIEADAFVFASPVYVMNVTPQMSAFFSRMRPLHAVKGGKLKDKVATAIAVGGTRHGGQEQTVGAIVNACLTRGIVYVGGEPGFYSGAMAWSEDKGAAGIDADLIAVDALKCSGKRIARWARISALGKAAADKAEAEKK